MNIREGKAPCLRARGGTTYTCSSPTNQRTDHIDCKTHSQLFTVTVNINIPTTHVRNGFAGFKNVTVYTGWLIFYLHRWISSTLWVWEWQSLDIIDRLSGLGLLGAWADFEQEDATSWKRYDTISADTFFRSSAGITPTLYDKLVSPLLHVFSMTPGYDCSAAAAL
jgi:hypothetical protein